MEPRGFKVNLQYLEKIKEFKKFAIHPVEILEDLISIDTSDYKEREKLMKAAKREIRQNEKEMDQFFLLVGTLQTHLQFLKFAKKTSFNTQSIISFANEVGFISEIFKELVKLNNKLQGFNAKGQIANPNEKNAFRDAYGELKELLDFNVFDVFLGDIETMKSIANKNLAEYNAKYPSNQMSIDDDNQIYIESFKDGVKKYRESK